MTVISAFLSWPDAEGFAVEVGAQALDDAWSDVLAELEHAPVEVVRLTPANLQGAFSAGPVILESSGAGDVAGCGFASCCHQFTSAYFSCMLDKDWKSMAERLCRSFVNLRQVVEDTVIDDQIDSSDALRQFCRHAFELRDWLLRADIDESAKSSVSELFGKPSHDSAKRVLPKSTALAACADIANRSKHAVLTGPSYSEGGYAEVTGESMSSIKDLPEFARQFVDDVPRFGDNQWMWIITINGQDHDALLLAEDAMSDWTSCLTNAGLVAPHPNGWSYLEPPNS